MFKQFTLLFVVINLLFANSITATNYYCDPINGNMNSNGTSETSAWGSLKDLFGSYKSSQLVEGDVVYLMNGMHNRIYIAKSNSGYITIKALDGHNPKLGGIQFGEASFWAFEDLTFTADGTGGEFSTSFINTNTTTTNLKISNCKFYMEEDSSSWSFNDWYTNTQNKSYFALRIRGDGFIFNDNHIKNVYFALLTEGSNIEIKNNIIENFGADAIQMHNCSNVLIEGNIIRNAYLENYKGNIGGQPSNHDDAIQLLGLATTLDNIVVVRNKIYNFFDPTNQDMIKNNLVSYQMQGIFLTDGNITNSLFENNLVIIDTYHGISLNSSDNTRIQNNTVIRNPNHINSQNTRPWVAFYDGSKGGTHTNGIIRNNLATQVVLNGDNVLENNKIVALSTENTYFSDYTNYDFTLLKNSTAVDAGVNNDLSTIDLAENNRHHGGNVDVGAYEYVSSLSSPLFDKSNSFKVYPTNINNGIITIESNNNLIGKELEIKLISIEGKIIFTKKIRVSLSKSVINIDEVNSSNSNIFILKISSSALSETYKLVK